MTCPPEAAKKGEYRATSNIATSVWSKQHSGQGWQDTSRRKHSKCQKDEFPPASLLGPNDEALIESGKNRKGQLVRWIPGTQNGGAGKSLFSQVCFWPEIFQRELKNIADFDKAFKTTVPKKVETAVNNKDTKIHGFDGEAVVAGRPELFIDFKHTPKPEDGLRDNPCWPKGIAAKYPGFVLLTYDPYYNGIPPPYRYDQPYQPGRNGE